MPDSVLQTQAELHFGFLVSEKGYRCTDSTPSRVRFESPTTFIELVYDSDCSFELTLLVGKISSEASGNPSFSIAEILRLRKAPGAEKFSLVQVTSNEALGLFVDQMAQMLRTHGGDFIAGNEKRFAELAEQRQRDVKTYALERDLKNARAEAEAAWQKKDYAAVVKALKPLYDALTTVEVGKLEFAEKQFRRDGYN